MTWVELAGQLQDVLWQVEEFIDENPHISLNDIEALTSLCRSPIVNIIHMHLNKRKLSSRWIPHLLTIEQKLKRITFFTNNLKIFEEGKWRLCDVVTGDESWIYYRKIKKKAMYSAWVGPGDSPGTVVKRNQFEPKNMITIFFKSTGALFVDVSDKGKSIGKKYYLNKSPKPLVKLIKLERPISSTKNIKLLHDNILLNCSIITSIRKVLSWSTIHRIRQTEFLQIFGFLTKLADYIS